MSDIYILGIESSCDDTSAAVLKNGVLLSNVTASQAVHEAYQEHMQAEQNHDSEQ